MADPAKYRTKEDVEQWKQRDPILTLGEKLDSLGMQDVHKSIDDEIEREVEDAVKFAEESPFPAAETAGDYVYA